MAEAYELYAQDIDKLVAAGVMTSAQAATYKQAYAQQHPETTPEARQAAFQAAGGVPAATAAIQQSWANGGGGPVNPGLAQTQAQGAVAQQQFDQANALNARYGTDLSWLDPSFRYQPTMLGQPAAASVYADPNAVNAQTSILNQIMATAATPLNFQSPAQQQSILNRIQGLSAPNWAGSANLENQAYGQIQNSYRPQWDTAAAQQQQSTVGALQGLQGPQFGSPQQQQHVYDQANARASGQGAPVFGSSADEQQALSSLFGISSSDQNEQLQNLKDIIAGGGATKIEMAARQSQRADEEQWLRSQREADEQQFAEKGLMGSGSELMQLAADRQASAGRNSLADLQTASALEQRRMQAITSAAGLAGDIRGQDISQQQAAGNLAATMRGQTYQEQSYLDQAKLQALGLSAQEADALRQAAYQEGMGTASWNLDRQQAVGNLLSNMRNSTFQEQSAQAQNDLSRALGLGDLASNMRTQNFQEQSYNSSFALDQQNAAANIANAMRADQMQEQLGQRNATMNALGMGSDLATNLRNSSYNEALGRASSLDQFSIINQSAINQANQANTQYLQNAYQNMMQQRQAWQTTNLLNNTSVAQGLNGADVSQQEYGYGQSQALGSYDASAYNQAEQARNAALAAANAGTANQYYAAQGAQNAAVMGSLPVMGQWFDTIGSMAGGNPYAAGSGGTTQLQQPSLGDSSGYGSSPNYGTSVAGSSSQSPQLAVNWGQFQYDPQRGY